MGMNFMLPKSQSMYTSTGDYLIGDGLTERGPILIDIPTTQIAAHSSQSIPKLYPIIGLCKELPGIALPLPIPLDLPEISLTRKVTSITSHQLAVREQPIKTGSAIEKSIREVSNFNV